MSRLSTNAEVRRWVGDELVADMEKDPSIEEYTCTHCGVMLNGCRQVRTR